MKSRRFAGSEPFPRSALLLATPLGCALFAGNLALRRRWKASETGEAGRAPCYGRAMHRRGPAVLVAIVALGCSGEDAERGRSGESVFVVPASIDELAEESFFDHPWPSDLRKESDGTVRFAGYPNPRKKPLIKQYVDSMQGILTGFSPVAAGYVRFTVALESDSLPKSPLEAIDEQSSVQLIDVDPASPEHGQRKRVALLFRAEPGAYWQENTLAFMPALGHPLRPSTRYALVVTNAVKAKGGGSIEPSADLRGVLGKDSASAPIAAARAVYADAIAELEQTGIAAGKLVHLAVFTTNDPTAETAKIRDWVRANYPAPNLLPGTLAAKEQVTGLMDVYEGQYGPSPDFQSGNIPFAEAGDGGALAFDSAGTPVVQREFNLRFALTVPDATSCPMPAAGYPIVLYAHGTGGNYRSMIGPSDEANALAKRCIAAMGIDQIFHGTRPGSGEGTEELLFFNVENTVAARANGPQSAIDVVQQARLFTESGTTVPASVSRTGSEIRFDKSRLAFVGHSQGGLNGPLFLAVDDAARGGMLSGSASLIAIALLEKTKPVDVAGLVRSVFLGLSSAEFEELSVFHPAISLAQTIVDPTDPIHYVPLIALRPRQGFAAKSLMQTEGVNPDGSGDTYSPPHGIEIQAVAAGLPPQEPIIHPIAELSFSDLVPVTIPSAGLSGNLAGGAASGVLAQWRADDASDGHFVLYDVPGAMTQATGFVRNLMDEPIGRVPPP